MTPSTTGWQTALSKLYCGAHNSMAWAGELPLPEAPAPGCWLLPATDVTAVAVPRSRCAPQNLAPPTELSFGPGSAISLVAPDLKGVISR